MTSGAVLSRPAPVPALLEPVCLAEGTGLVLVGDLEWRVAEVIAVMRQFAETRSEIYVDCRRLRRVDFGAAGELLNEIVALKSAGKRVRMGGVSPLVGALLAVMGIPDLIEVRLRGY